jgi:hypothetical protein
MLLFPLTQISSFFDFLQFICECIGFGVLIRLGAFVFDSIVREIKH